MNQLIVSNSKYWITHHRAPLGFLEDFLAFELEPVPLVSFCIEWPMSSMTDALQMKTGQL